MNISRNKKNIAIVIISTCLVFLLVFLSQSLFHKETIVLEKQEKAVVKKQEPRELDYDISLKDKNDVHLKYATKNGLKEIFCSDEAFLAVADSLKSKGELVYVSEKRNYVLKKLTHSHPYLTREARDLLNEIGTRFSKKQIEKGLKPHKIIVTSMLRTDQSQCHLRRRNRNATTDVSAHLYGTTFDISSRKFVRKDIFGTEKICYQLEYKRLLENILQELRFEGRCAVVREYKQGCYHITVVK